MLNSRQIVFIFLVAVSAGSLSAAQIRSLPVVVQEEGQQGGSPSQDDSANPDDQDPRDDMKLEEQSEGNSNEKLVDPQPGDDPDDEMSESEEPRPRRSRRRGKPYKQFSKQADDLANTFSPIVASASGSVVKITDGKRQIALGTIVDSGGLILTKASELRGELKCKLVDGKELPARVLGIDEATDLALLRVDANELSEAPWSAEVAPQVGAWLANVSQKNLPLSIGIVSHNQRKIANSKAMIGIYLQERDSGGVRITRVTADSPADEAGLLVNDVIMGVDDVDTLTHQDLREKLAEFEPGDRIKLKLERSGKNIEVDLTLASEAKINPMSAVGSPQDRMGSSLSRRRNNFPLALQHDSILNANQCGGPLVDLSGRVIGINIARDGRVSSLALPTEVVLPVVQRLKSGEFAPEVINREAIDAIDQQLKELKKSLGDLPERKMKAEIGRSAALAQQDELEHMIRELEDRLEKVKDENKAIVEKAEKLSTDMRELEKKRQRLDADRQRLATGVR